MLPIRRAALVYTLILAAQFPACAADPNLQSWAQTPPMAGTVGQFCAASAALVASLLKNFQPGLKLNVARGDAGGVKFSAATSGRVRVAQIAARVRHFFILLRLKFSRAPRHAARRPWKILFQIGPNPFAATNHGRFARRKVSSFPNSRPRLRACRRD